MKNSHSEECVQNLFKDSRSAQFSTSSCYQSMKACCCKCSQHKVPVTVMESQKQNWIKFYV